MADRIRIFEKKNYSFHKHPEIDEDKHKEEAGRFRSKFVYKYWFKSSHLLTPTSALAYFITDQLLHACSHSGNIAPRKNYVHDAYEIGIQRHIFLS